jgi:cytochrome c-type biogenesis protein CcmE
MEAASIGQDPIYVPFDRSRNWGKGSPVLIDRGLEPFDEFGDEAPARSNRTRFLVLSAVIILALGYMIYAAFPGNALYFLTVSEFNELSEVQDGRVLRVSGKLVEGTFDRDGKSIDAKFLITDNDGDSPGATLVASYTGVLPDLFFNPHSELILEGSYGGNEVFHANAILVKCPSKYVDLEDELNSAQSPAQS